MAPVAFVLALFLFAVTVSAEEATAVSQRCEEDTDTFLREINQKTPEEYAVLMYDAFGKIGSNIKGGNVNRPGLLEQCQSAQGPTFSGQYCQVFLQQGTVQYFVGVCVPDSCSEGDLQSLVLHGRLQFGQASLIPPIPSILVNETSQEMIMTHCLSDTIAPDAAEVTCLFVCCLMVAIPLAATVLSALIWWQRNREVSPSPESSCINSLLNHYGTLKSNGSCGGDTNKSTSEENNVSDGNNSRTSPCLPRLCVDRLLQAFSLQNTCQGVLNTNSIPGGGYSSLNGIRVMSLLWIVSGHTAQFTVINNLDNYNDWQKAFQRSPLHVFCYSGPVYLGVDTFLLLGGLLSARSLINSINRADGKQSVSLVANYLFNRIKRIQPLHIFITCLAIGFYSLVLWGPYWFPHLEAVMDCKTYWWANVLLVSNLLNVPDICTPWSWYLSLDFQCYATTPLLIYLFKLNRGIFVFVAGGLLLLTTAAGAIVTALMQLPVFQPASASYFRYILYYYDKPYMRYGPYLIGILTGIYLKTKREPLINKKWKAALGWLCSLSVMAAVVGLAYALKETPDYPSVPHAIYQGLHRTLWTAAVSWIIIACEEGYGGFIMRFLSMGFWNPLANISFGCYMIHPILIIVYAGVQGAPIHYTDLNFMYLFFGHMVPTLAIGYLLTVLIEKPYFLKYN